MKRKGFTLIQIIVLVFFAVLIAAVLFPYFAAPRGRGPGPICQTNLKQLSLAFAMYSQDNDDRLPQVMGQMADTCLPPYNKPYGWADALQTYLKSSIPLEVMQCPAEDSPANKKQDAVLGHFTDYYFNTNLSGTKLSSVTSAAVILVGDGNDGTDGTDARYNRDRLPQAWRDDPNSPARRHNDGAFYLFADCHVKWLKPEKVYTDRSHKKLYSFAVK